MIGVETVSIGCATGKIRAKPVLTGRPRTADEDTSGQTIRSLLTQDGHTVVRYDLIKDDPATLATSYLVMGMVGEDAQEVKAVVALRRLGATPADAESLRALLIDCRIELRKLSRDSQDRIADSSALAGEILNAMPTVQAFTHEKIESQRFGQSVESAFVNEVAVDVHERLARPHVPLDNVPARPAMLHGPGRRDPAPLEQCPVPP